VCRSPLQAWYGIVTFSNRVHDDRNAIVRAGKGIFIPAHRLDSLPLPDGEITLLKMDVEGYEKFVVEGARHTLRRTACVHIEVWPEAARGYGYESRAVTHMLSESGFLLFSLGPDGSLHSVPDTYQPPRIMNLVAVRDLADFRARTGLKIS
jgi:Methyltransferase FkbM domain